MKLIEKVKKMNLLDKFRNKKVFALYLVGVLLLSTGISFAYFTARTNAEGEGGVATVTTTTVTSQGITADGNIDFNNVDMYLGHTAIASIRVTGRGNNEPLMYNVIFNGSSTFTTPLNYTVYKSDANIDASYSCEIKQDRLGTSKIYYEECTGNNIENLGTPISSGTINNGEGKTTLKNDEIILTSPEGEEVYYYIVIEYPNLDANQNDDMGSSISGNITIEQGNEYQKPVMSMIGSTVSGSNNWYTSASIITNITTQTGNYEAYYCTTTSDSCTPDTQANISDNSFTTTLTSNASPQKVCARVVDEYNQTTEGCSEAYSVDTVNPTVSITSTSATENSITVTVSGSDAHSGIYQYRFSSNGGSSYTTVTTSNSSYTYTFTGLNSGTSYNIAVQSIDRSGRISSTVIRSVETVSYCPNGALGCDTILANNKVNFGTPSFSKVATTDEGVWTAEDDLGTSYYFRGAVSNNYVSFAGFYWRIIRINGDGTIRLIYDGTTAHVNGESSDDRQIGTSAYTNVVDVYDASIGVGFTYTLNMQRPSSQNGGTDSTIKGILDTWYTNNIVRQNLDDKVVSTPGFCNDRDMASGYSWSLRPSSEIRYAAYERLITNKAPTLLCNNTIDLYTTKVGLIIADEVAYAGGVIGVSNTSYYLYTGQRYWAMSPSFFSGGLAYVFGVNLTGYLVNISDSSLVGVRPVINLRADVTLTGSGTISDPYVVS